MHSAGYTKGKSSTDDLILQHVPFVKYHAYRLAAQLPSSVEIDDLINAGVLGLMDAAAKFDPSRGVKFKTYAELRIRGAMIDGLRELDWVPQAVRRKGKELREARERLQHQLGREVDDQEVCREIGMDIKELHELREQLSGRSIGTFCESPNQAEGENQVEYYPDSLSNGPHFQFQKQELRKILAGAIDQLDPKERLVVSLYYFEELTMKEIGAVLGVKEARVSQIHTKAVIHLRRKLTNSGFRLSNPMDVAG
jgi:RNA polymerase sigma factor FliA